MSRLLQALSISIGLAQAAHCLPEPKTVYGYDTIEPSVDLAWTPCFEGLKCSKLQVPIDYANPDLGTTSIAFVKKTAKNATAETPSIVVIPGGPGGSGIALLLENEAVAGQAFGDQYNLVSFDPRGVNNSGLHLDCFPGNPEARSTFSRLQQSGTTNISATSFQEQYYASSIYGDWCDEAVKNDSHHAYYVTTPAVAHDLLEFTKAEARAAGRPSEDAKLWSYGVSYGTVIGATFASMFPERVGRMVLDGVLDAELYYDNAWTDNVDQMDEAMEEFGKLCHSAGPKKCAFYGPSPEDIMNRIDKLLIQLRDKPIPVSGVQVHGLPSLVTYSDLKAAFLNALYGPVSEFPPLAEALRKLETEGEATTLAGTFRGLNSILDSRMAIMCADSSRRNNLTTIENFQRYLEYTTSESKYLGDLWPIFQENILCRGMDIDLPDSMLVQGRIEAIKTPTHFPVLFASTTIDPLSPVKGAHIMSSRFANSSVLLQEAVGHTVLSQFGSECYARHLQQYYAGIVPSANTTCEAQFVPFIDSLDSLI